MLVAALALGCFPGPATADSRATVQTTRLRLATEHTSGAVVKRIGRIVVSRRGTPACWRRCSVRLARGDEVILRARAARGYAFDHWVDASRCEERAASSDTCTVRATGGTMRLIATFAPRTYTLAVSPSGRGRISSGGNGIECGEGADLCTATFLGGTEVTLTMTPAPGSTFVKWSVWQCPGRRLTCTVRMDRDRVVTGLLDPVYLTVERYGQGGVVTSDPPGISCGPDCTEQTGAFRRDERVTLTARAEDGPPFRRWSDPCGGGIPSCTFTLLDDQRVAATFGDVAPPAFVRALPGGFPTLRAADRRVRVTVDGPGLVTAPGANGVPNAIRCPKDCGAWYPTRYIIPFRAHPSRNARLVRWVHACAHTRLICTIPPMGHEEIRVVFRRN